MADSDNTSNRGLGSDNMDEEKSTKFKARVAKTAIAAVQIAIVTSTIPFW